MIKVHPPNNMLHQYVAGDINSAAGLVISTHIDMCTHCQRLVKAMEDELSSSIAHSVNDSQSRLDNADMQSMLDTIFKSAPPERTPLNPDDKLIYLNGQRFNLPRSLARQKNRIGPWSKMVGNMWRAAIYLGASEVAHLIYMGNAASLPEHTHNGTELQLVLNGSFSDEYGHYQGGDLLFLDATHQHSPRTNGEDCLLLTVFDGPLQFTSGINRLLNPFSNLFLR